MENNQMPLKKEKMYEVLRKIIIVIYACALPVTIIFVLLGIVSLVFANQTDGIFELFMFLVPVSIVIALVMSLKRKKNIWLILPLIAIALVLVDGAVSSHFEQKGLQDKYAPLSTRGLPPPATDVPVVLPPDSGQAGKATLAGIDSDHDGVRDDLEREIVYMYPQNQEIRRVLTAMVKKEQEFVTTNGGSSYYQGLHDSYMAFYGCYAYLAISETGESDNTNFLILLKMLTNTPEREKVYDENIKLVSSSASSGACNSSSS